VDREEPETAYSDRVDYARQCVDFTIVFCPNNGPDVVCMRRCLKRSIVEDDEVYWDVSPPAPQFLHCFHSEIG
jgi:hypothetical protein